MYDAIIIGAGMSGLVCGCYLAKAGMKVLIVEQHDKPGGYFTSFKRKGFLFDAAAHSFGNYRETGHVRKILAEIGVDKIITVQRFDPSDIVITPEFTITFWNDKKKTVAGLADIFPAERRAIELFFDFLTASHQSEFAKLKGKTFGTLLRSFFKDEKLINSIAFPVFGNGGLPPSLMHAFSGSKIFSEFIIDGGYYPEGGIQTLPDAFEKIITQNRGMILYKKLVKKILCRDGEVTGVTVDTNKSFTAKYVVSACDMIQTFETLLGDGVIDKHIIAHAKRMIPSLSTFILYLGIDKPFEGLPHPGTNTWCLPNYDLDQIYAHIEKGNFDKAGYMLRVSPDQKTVLAFFGAPYKTSAFWKENKKNIAEAFLDRIGKLIPDLRKHIVYCDAASPSTLYRYTHNFQGAAFGWAKMPSQTFDPVLSRPSFIKGFYLTGHWTSIAFGLPGTCYSGYDTAKRILRKESIR